LKELIYLYCVTKAKPVHINFEELETKVYPVYFQGSYAVVSNVSPDEFREDKLKKNLGDMEWVEKKVLRHEKIIERIMREVTVIPFKFGTIFHTEENVKKLLKDRCVEFKRTIANLEGKEEWGVKIYCNLEKFRIFIEGKEEKNKEKAQEIASTGKGRAYFLKKKQEWRVNNILNDEISDYTHDTFDRLKKASIDAKINKLLPREVTQKKEKMVLNAAFLVNKKRIKEFNQVMEYIKAKYSDKGFIFDYTGPWPPYNFCSIDEKGI
jgi:hypothetical protein